MTSARYGALLLGALLVAVAPASAEDSASRVQGACGPGVSVVAGVPWRQAQTPTLRPDLSGWTTRDTEVDGKPGSGIQVFHRFAQGTLKPGKLAELTLAFDRVEHEPALAYFYPLDGAEFAEPGKTGLYIELKAGSLNVGKVRIRVPGEGGGVAIVTCQKARSTIFSVPLPGRAFTRQPLPGQLTTDSRGEPIIRMQAQ